MQSLNEKGIKEKHENCNLNFNPFLSFIKVIKCTAANLDIMETWKGENQNLQE